MNYTTSKIHLDIKQGKSTPQKGFIAGYASIFGHLDEQGDRVMKGAFKNSLTSIQKKSHWPKMLWQHNPKEPIGQWSRIIEDEKGLYVEGTLLLDVQKGQEAYAFLKEGIIDGLSIGYRVVEAHQSPHSNERLLTQVDLREVSLVTFAANEKATITEVKTNESLPQRIYTLAQKIKNFPY